jgi:diguanylate cyclase (GGDEF)-like protein/PAS domain S-box-containing protein
MDSAERLACEGERRSRRLIRSFASCAIYMLDKTGNVSTWNRNAQRMSGYSAEEIVGKPDSIFYTPEGRVTGQPDFALGEAVKAGRYETQGWCVRRDDSQFWASVMIEPICEDGTLVGFAKVTRDLTRDRDAKEAHRHLEVALACTPHGLALFDDADVLVFANVKFCELLGIPEGRIFPGMKLGQMLEIGVSADAAAAFDKGCRGTVSECVNREVRIPAGDVDFILAITQQCLPSGGWVETVQDVTERRRTEHQLERLAHYDSLTGIPNRALFNEHLQEAFSRSRRGSNFALLSVDIDRFRSVNETFGHSVGDELLKVAAQRLRTCTRLTDTVARIGADEFAIIQTGIRGPKDADKLAARVAKTLRQPYVLGLREVFAGASIGVALVPGDGTDVDVLLRHADLALSRAKGNRDTSYSFCEPGLDGEIEIRHALEHDLHQALRRNEFEIFYQSMVDLETDSVVGYEALLRWRHPVRGLLAPAEFIPAAEESGQIVQIGEWVLRTALQQASTSFANFRVAVNLSPDQLRDGKFADTLSEALALSGVKADRLELEITESTLLQNCESTLQVLRQLQNMGIRIVLDDFGTGFSSLSYLRDFPFDKLKIDRSFVRDLPDSEQARVLVKAIAGLGASFHIAVTAEGVENCSQLEFVRTAGCSEAQGFHFDRPQPAAGVLADNVGSSQRQLGAFPLPVRREVVPSPH